MTAAWGYGLTTYAADNSVLDTWFPAPALGERPGDAEAPADLLALEGSDDARGVTRKVNLVEVADLASAPADTAEVWLRLHLVSQRLVAPHGQNLDGIFGLLTNVVWTSAGPCAVEGFETTRARLQAAGRHVSVYGVDKFPRMVDYVLPTGVRIADADRVRLGAHLAEGTTVMHEGFVNFNAGTLGASMVEGRISAGVLVGDGSDVGGGASIMGTLSGGGKEVISVGERCLVGANAGIGISLGDDCVVGVRDDRLGEVPIAIIHVQEASDLDEAGLRGVLDPGNGMGVSFGDYNNDGRLDLHASNMSSTAGNRILTRLFPNAGPQDNVLKKLAAGNNLFENVGDGKFKDVTAAVGGFSGGWAWGGGFIDFYNDGWEDIYTPNGFISGKSMKDT